jgi:hypothetical protein
MNEGINQTEDEAKIVHNGENVTNIHELRNNAQHYNANM